MEHTKILQTEDYDIFKEIASNREVDHRHVKHLKEAIRQVNLLHLNPIIINSEMEVIDGQHRLQAAREMKIPIHFIIDDKITKRCIAGLNSNQKNWSMLDYVNYYAVEKIPEYLVLSDFINRHPSISVSTLIQLLNPAGERNSREFKEGNLDVSNSDLARKILDHIEKIRNIGIDIAYDRNFILAIKECFLLDDYKPEQFLAKLEANRIELFKCAKKQQYLQLIEQIYNKRQHI